MDNKIKLMLAWDAAEVCLDLAYDALIASESDDLNKKGIELFNGIEDAICNASDVLSINSDIRQDLTQFIDAEDEDAIVNKVLEIEKIIEEGIYPIKKIPSQPAFDKMDEIARLAGYK